MHGVNYKLYGTGVLIIMVVAVLLLRTPQADVRNAKRPITSTPSTPSAIETTTPSTIVGTTTTELTTLKFPVSDGDSLSDPITLPEALDAGVWESYKNVKYDFEFGIPPGYEVINRDPGRSLDESRSLLLRKGDGATKQDIAVRVIPRTHLDEIIFRLGTTGGLSGEEYLAYIREKGKQVPTRDLSSEITFPVELFYFDAENPGEFGDARSTMVGLLEMPGVILVLRNTPAEQYPHPEFVSFLTRVR